MAMTTSTKIRDVFHVFGYDENKQKWRGIPLFMAVSAAVMCVGAVPCIFDGNLHLLLRIMAAKDVNMILTGLACSSMLFNDNMRNLLNIIDNGYSNYDNKFSLLKKGLINQCEMNQVKVLNKLGALIVVAGVILMILLPGLGVAYVFYSNGIKNTNISDLPLPAMFQYPNNYDVMHVYIVIYVLQLIYLVHIYSLGYCIFGAVACTFQSIITNIKLFCIDIKDFDKNVGGTGATLLNTLKLHDYTNYLIRYHQQMIRHVNLLTHSIALSITICNQWLCFAICVFVYCTAEVDDKFQKLVFCILAVFFSIILLVYCTGGQKIIDSSEEIRNALYECPWVDKPQWLKMDLQLMMAMANAPLHVKPYGVYVLNFKAYSNILNAAYTYFNLLTTVKK